MATYMDSNNLLYEAFNSIPTSDATIKYIKDNVASLGERISTLGADFIDRINTAVAYRYNDDTMEYINNTMSRLNTIVSDDYILDINHDRYVPNTNTKRYIMLTPELYALHVKQKCNSFGNRFYDADPDVTDINDKTDYNLATSGALMFNKDGTGYIRHSICNINELDIKSYDKDTVLMNMEKTRYALLLNLDPSDIKLKKFY